jgi:hypothetical protein
MDYIQVFPKTNHAYVWYNQCPGGKSNDDGPIVDPHLPVLPVIPPAIPDDSDGQAGAYINAGTNVVFASVYGCKTYPDESLRTMPLLSPHRVSATMKISFNPKERTRIFVRG